MKTEIIIVGDEVLAGAVIDTNSAALARGLADLGLTPQKIIKVGDDKRAIEEVLKRALGEAELVVVAGGMGPTPDDKTVEAVAHALSIRLVLHRPTLMRIQRTFQKRGMRMPALAARQALVLKGAKLLDNPVGMVPGMIVTHQGSTVVLLPGVPVEMEAILTTGVLPYLRKRFVTNPPSVLRLRTFGLPESRIAEKSARLFRRYPALTPAFYPSTTGVDVVIRGRSKVLVERCGRGLVRLLGETVYAVGDKEIALVVGEALRRCGLTVATAESCTGGLVGDMLTNIPGSSDYYRGGVVAYSNEMKLRLLGVRAETLKRHGAVSAQTVREMARGVCRLMAADIGIAVSGIAGPTGGTRKKPVGLVFIAVAAGEKILVERHIFSGSRRMVKERAAMAALDLCRRAITSRRPLSAIRRPEKGKGI
ncbi:MAG: competence/damage-inducible protein A [candidate division WOR-3 bacterium]